MTSQGQRFRRRALRRGYKVDEVDNFLDRVEATLNGEHVGPVVIAQEVHDIVFRVRFGGYDEWQVDLHLDRVERQLAEFAERHAAALPRGVNEQRMTAADRLTGSERRPQLDRMGMADRGGIPNRAGLAAAMGDRPGLGERMNQTASTERIGPPMRDERMMPRDDHGVAGWPVPGPSTSGGYPSFDDAPTRYQEPVRYDPPRYSEPPPRYGEPPRSGTRSSYDDGGRYDEPAAPGGYGGGFESSRYGRSDLTGDLRLPSDLRDSGMPSGEAARVDELRRGFQPRRFGSGYDQNQVDRLFEGILAALTGRSGRSIGEAELDPGQFDLVAGGYFEAEVDQALREVRDMLMRRR